MTIREGSTAHFSLQVSETDMKRFAELSGDRNPVHFETARVREKGYDGPLVYGGLLLAAVSRLLGMHLPGPGCIWHNVSMKFIAPLYVNQEAEVKGTVTYANPEMNVYRVQLEIQSQGRLIAKGEAQGGLWTPAKKPGAPAS